MVEPGVLLPEAGFSTFYVELMFTHTLVWVDILSRPQPDLGVLKVGFRKAVHLYYKTMGSPPLLSLLNSKSWRCKATLVVVL